MDSVPDRLYAKGYRYQIRFPSGDIETLYAKTLLDATRVARDYSDQRTTIVKMQALPNGKPSQANLS